MIINNINLRNKLGMNRLMSEDNGAGNGSNTATNDSNTDDNNKAEGDDNGADKESNQTEEKTFTQAELDKIIEKRLQRERNKLEKEYQDKINEGINNGLDEAKKLEKMTAREKAEYDYNKRLAELEKREQEYAYRELKQSAMSILNDKGFSVDDAKIISTILDYSDADKCKASIDSIEKLINGLVEKGVNNKIKTNKTPVSKETTQSNVFTYEDYIANPTAENYKRYKDSKKK